MSSAAEEARGGTRAVLKGIQGLNIIGVLVPGARPPLTATSAKQSTPGQQQPQQQLALTLLQAQLQRTGRHEEALADEVVLGCAEGAQVGQRGMRRGNRWETVGTKDVRQGATAHSACTLAHAAAAATLASAQQQRRAHRRAAGARRQTRPPPPRCWRPGASPRRPGAGARLGHTCSCGGRGGWGWGGWSGVRWGGVGWGRQAGAVPLSQAGL